MNSHNTCRLGKALMGALILAALFCTLGLAGLCAAEPVSFKSNLGGSARHAIMSGSYLYSLIGSRMYIHDVSDIANPVVKGSVPIPGKGRRAALQGSKLYIACSEGGLVVVDVSDPSSPQQVGVMTFDTGVRITNTFDVELHGSLAYVADYNGFYIIDISNPAAMSVRGSFTAFDSDHPHTYGVHVSGGYAYVCCEFDGLYIFSVADPANIVLQSHFSGSPENGLHNQYYDSIREGDYLYLAAGGDGFVILDVSDLQNPAFVSMLDNDYGGILGLVKVGNFIYPFSEFYNQPEIDVSDVTSPQQTEVFDVEGHHSLGINVYENYLLLANSTYGIRIFDISQGSLNQVGALKTIGRVMDCQGRGKYAFIAAAQNGLKVLDMTDPSTPRLAATFELMGYANGLAIDGDVAYFAELLEEGGTGGRLEAVDISDPLAPVSLGSVQLEGEPYDITIKDTIAYVACQTKGLALVDISVPSSPALLASFDSGGSCYKAALWGDYIIGADGVAGFFVLKQDGTALHNVRSGFDAGVVQNLALWDNNIFLPATQADKGLKIYDISQPYAPLELAQIDSITDRTESGQIKAVEAVDSYLLVAESVGGLRLFDIADPADPVELATMLRTVQGDPVRVSYSREQGLAYVSAQIIGMYIYDVSLPEPSDADLEGLWIGSGSSEDLSVGIAAELDQAHDTVTGTVRLFGAAAQELSVSAAVSDATTVAGIVSDALSSEIPVSDVQMKCMGPRGHLDLDGMLSGLSGAVAARTAATDTFVEQLGLSTVQSFIDSALAASDLSTQLSQLAVAECIIPAVTQDGAIAAVDSYLRDTAFYESFVTRAIVQNQRDDICSDYERELGFYDDRGDDFMDRASERQASGNDALALSLLGRANRAYEKVSELYAANKPSCPEWGIAKLDGYYEGTVDFVGIISGIFKVCVREDDAGNITGATFIELEASDEFMGGPITEATNDATTGISVVNGVFVVQIGEKDIPLEMQDWRYDPSAGKWVGKIYVELQEATGNITIERVSDECPEGWNVH